MPYTVHAYTCERPRAWERPYNGPKKWGFLLSFPGRQQKRAHVKTYGTSIIFKNSENIPFIFPNITNYLHNFRIQHKLLVTNYYNLVLPAYFVKSSFDTAR